MLFIMIWNIFTTLTFIKTYIKYNSVISYKYTLFLHYWLKYFIKQNNYTVIESYVGNHLFNLDKFKTYLKCNSVMSCK